MIQTATIIEEGAEVVAIRLIPTQTTQEEDTLNPSRNRGRKTKIERRRGKVEGTNSEQGIS